MIFSIVTFSEILFKPQKGTIQKYRLKVILRKFAYGKKLHDSIKTSRGNKEIWSKNVIEINILSK